MHGLTLASKGTLLGFQDARGLVWPQATSAQAQLPPTSPTDITTHVEPPQLQRSPEHSVLDSLRSIVPLSFTRKQRNGFTKFLAGSPWPGALRPTIHFV